MLRRPPTALSITKDDVDEIRQAMWSREKEPTASRNEPRQAPERPEAAAPRGHTP